MTTTMSTDPGGHVPLVCTDCGQEIDCCEFCDRTECRAGLCYRCVNLALGQLIPQPHVHGG